MEVSVRMLSALQPRLNRDPEVAGFEEWMGAALDSLPKKMRHECMMDITVNINR